MSLVEMDGSDDGKSRPWGKELGFNNPKRVATWKALERESIQQRAGLGMELTQEEQAILDELTRGRSTILLPAPPVPQEPSPEPAPEQPKRRRKKRDTKTLMRQAIARRHEERDLFN